MVFIDLKQEGNLIIMDCHKGAENGEYFRMILDKDTREVLERPEHVGVDEATAYSHVNRLLKSGRPLPKHTVSEWG